MNLNKMFVFIFVFFVVFAAFLVNMPSAFIDMEIDANVQDKEVVEYFTAQHVLMYNETYLANMSYPSGQDVPFGLDDDEKLEFWWKEEFILGFSIGPILQVRHHTKHWLGWWWTFHRLSVQEPYITRGDVSQPDLGLKKDEVLSLFVEDYNASYCEFGCDHLDVKMFIVTANQSWTLEESWDNGQLKLFTSYEIDWRKTGYSMWAVMGKLLSFQNPNLGIPGIGGTILTAGFGGGLWACIAVLFFAIITAVIPFISGWQGGGG